MGIQKQKEIYVGKNSTWCPPGCFPINARFESMDWVWNYIWKLIYKRLLWPNIPTLQGVKLRCNCTTKYCHRHVLEVLASNPKMAFDLQSKIVLKGITQEQYDANPDNFPEAKTVLQSLWAAAGFTNTTVAEPQKPIVTIGEEILMTMRETCDFGTLDPEEEFPAFV